MSTRIRKAPYVSAFTEFRCSSFSRTAWSRDASSAPCRNRKSCRRSRSTSADGAGVHRKSELEVFAQKVAIVVVFVVGILLLWRVRDVLVLIFIAAVIAAGIDPAVRRVRVWGRFWFHRNIPRGAAIAIVYLPFVLAVLLIALVLV